MLSAGKGLLKRKNSGDLKKDNEGSKDSFLAITIVILLFVVAIIMMAYAYHIERNMRFELEAENKLNIEVIHACDRIQLRDKQIKLRDENIKSISCSPCEDCESIAEAKKAQAKAGFDLEYQTALSS